MLKTANLNHENVKGETALTEALSKEGNMEAVVMLLDRGARGDIGKDSENNSPLILACKRNHWDVFKKLCDQKDSGEEYALNEANLNHTNVRGETAFSEALWKDCHAIVELRDRGAQCEMEIDFENNSSLILEKETRNK